MLAGKFVVTSGKLLVAGKLVLITGTLLTPDTMLVVTVGPLVPLKPELVVEVSVELPGVFWLQPTNAQAARKVIADSVIMDFIIWLIHACCRR